MDRVSAELEREVVRRAAGRCEYCHFPESTAELPFHIDHIIARKHHGPTESGNLAWACFSCNLRKGPNIAGLDPVSGKLMRLFHPRRDKWSTHFEWHGAWLRGRTSVGRTTISLLDINDEDAIGLRIVMLEEGFRF